MTSHITSDSSKQHGAKQPVMLTKSFASGGKVIAAGTCIPPVVASSNELGRIPGRQLCNEINSQEGRVLNVNLKLRR